ncbi:geranylgeranyl pyrophosphate synthase [Owenweeksia hongkongensis DSM 17368]|uniref:Geranylgeranyl pyrophosphate synthase n=1 Tax=Owenweeksia hongkongensis (strain DSM 17368 / CIP 108786 / JCM 12287 / NRRL B-23963 / UST20020801) TaxID=926562 RepID=G8R302_OWEHD|nr:polyprenyl synthetase family protein [Owenweeksia hongkongensis]AEV32996.1 geranylgeranyl pyrophosphate synthase [Owenweeksia hongkongensis DSM 17368]
MEKINGYTALIERTLARQDFNDKPIELYEPISYILSLGGKRLRPALTLAACELFGGDPQEALVPALGIEIFHNFSLIHDDIMDKAPLRRGKKTVHEKWNSDVAILSGDAMLVKAYQYIVSVKPEILPSVIKVFNQTALEVCEGQQYDLNFETQDDVLEDDYIEMIRLKTSVLLGCALEIGALIAGASVKQADAIYSFGESIGIAFQIQDDILDAFGDPEKFGKATGGDILNNKNTILRINATHNSSPEQLASLEANYASDAEKVETVKGIFKDTGALVYAQSRMNEFYDEAIKHLKDANGSTEIETELATFAQWLIKRDL